MGEGVGGEGGQRHAHVEVAERGIAPQGLHVGLEVLQHIVVKAQRMRVLLAARQSIVRVMGFPLGLEELVLGVFVREAAVLESAIFFLLFK